MNARRFQTARPVSTNTALIRAIAGPGPEKWTGIGAPESFAPGWNVPEPAPAEIKGEMPGGLGDVKFGVLVLKRVMENPAVFDALKRLTQSKALKDILVKNAPSAKLTGGTLEIEESEIPAVNTLIRKLTGQKLHPALGSVSTRMLDYEKSIRDAAVSEVEKRLPILGNDRSILEQAIGGPGYKKEFHEVFPDLSDPSIQERRLLNWRMFFERHKSGVIHAADSGSQAGVNAALDDMLFYQWPEELMPEVSALIAKYRKSP